METALEVLAPEVQPLPRLKDNAFLWLTEQLAQLGKKAVKLGCEPPTLTVVLDETVQEPIYEKCSFNSNFTVETGRYKSVRYRTVEVTGGVPRLGGWDIVAVIEHTPAGNLLKKLPNSQLVLDERFKFTTTHLCDHCNVNRQRNDTFIVSNGTEQKQVGRSCLKDFTGHKNPEALAKWANSLCEALGRAERDEDDLWPRDRMPAPNTYVLEMIAQSVAVCRVDKGYKKAAEQSSTSNTVRDLLYPPRTYGSLADMAEQREYQRLEEVKYAVTPKDSQFAADAIAWAVALPETSMDYLWNLRVIGHTAWLEGFKNWGIACSLAHAYCNELKRTRAAAEVKASKPVSNYVGTVKGKVAVSVVITRTRCIESDWGTTTLYVMEDAQGNVYNWFASAYTPYATDDKVTLTGTVKDHKEYRDEKITLLTRCKLTA